MNYSSFPSEEEAMMETSAPGPKYYFVDEAGDPAIFGSRGKVLIGTEGCSRFFILGLADVENPEQLAKDLSDLRSKILADPYFKGVPSLQPTEGKTALFFHAKDDLQQIRRDVFALIRRHPIRFSAIVRDKLQVLDYVRSRNASDPDYHYQPNELYDFMVRRLFRERLHKHTMKARGTLGGQMRYDAVSFHFPHCQSSQATQVQFH